MLPMSVEHRTFAFFFSGMSLVQEKMSVCVRLIIDEFVMFSITYQSIQAFLYKCIKYQTVSLKMCQLCIRETKVLGLLRVGETDCRFFMVGFVVRTVL